MRFGRALVVVWLAALLASCGGDGGDVGDDAAGSPASRGLSGTLTVFAAASLSDAFQAISAALTAEHPELTIEFSFAGSQQLVTQLLEGADADVLATADVRQLDTAREGGIVADEATIFTTNRLVIVVPADNPAGIEEPADLGKEGVKLVIANEEVPVGRYTLRMLDLMATNPGFGRDIRERIEANVVSHEDNVRQVVAKVALGEADAGVVYLTDVTEELADRVRTVEVPGVLNVIAEYPIAPVADGDAELARAFIDFVLSEQGQAILADFGFTPLEK